MPASLRTRDDPCTAGCGAASGGPGQENKSEHLGVVWRRSAGLGRRGLLKKFGGRGGWGIVVKELGLLGDGSSESGGGPLLKVLGKKIWTPQQECSRN